jgi:hypothetical protein
LMGIVTVTLCLLLMHRFLNLPLSTGQKVVKVGRKGFYKRQPHRP